jgi:hypothetical protein
LVNDIENIMDEMGVQQVHAKDELPDDDQGAQGTQETVDPRVAQQRTPNAWDQSQAVYQEDEPTPDGPPVTQLRGTWRTARPSGLRSDSGSASHSEASEEDEVDEIAPSQKPLASRVYDYLGTIPFPKDLVTGKMDEAFAQWLDDLQAALQIPWETCLFELISLASTMLYRTTGQYTAMLGLPPLPWIGIAGKPGESKSVAIWFYKQVVMELQNRGNASLLAEDEENGDGAHPAEADGGGRCRRRARRR